MALKDEVMDLVLLAIRLKSHCLGAFGEIAQHRPVFRHKSLPQFKTEKWLQAELCFLLHQRYFVGSEIPCEDGYTCDLVIRPSQEVNNPVYIALKCYSASAQSPTGDAKSLIKDITWACADANANRIALVVLPLENGDYTKKLLGKVAPHCPVECSYRCRVCGCVLVGWWTTRA